MAKAAKTSSSVSEKDAAGRIPPQNLDAEKSLLGAILIDEEVLPPPRLLKSKTFTTRLTEWFSLPWSSCMNTINR